MTDHRLGFGLLFLAGGAICLAGGLERRRKRQRLLRRAVRVRARVVSVRTESSNDDGGIDFHYPTLEFRVGGSMVRAETIVGRGRGEEVLVGREVTAYYDPLDPTRMVLAPGDWPGGGCAAVLGLTSVLLGGVILCGGQR